MTTLNSDENADKPADKAVTAAEAVEQTEATETAETTTETVVAVEETRAATKTKTAVAAAKPAEADEADVWELEQLEAEADEADQPSPGIVAGAAAITAAGLALTSLGGNWLGNILAQRQTLIGQISSQGASKASDMIQARYTDPWHKTAFVSFGFATAAILIAAVTLLLGDFAAVKQPPAWVRALLWGAVALGVVGLGVSAAMYWDVFTSTIKVPTAPGS